jgi:phenylalanyl-tRNA synthetase beta chain
VLLECAYFDPRRTRRTRTALGLSTDASYRFERGVDHEATAARLARAAQLIVAVAGGRVTGAVDVVARVMAPRTLFLRDARLTQVLGAAVARSEVERTLTGIGCVVSPKEDRCAVQVPAWRPDLEREIDLVEEVARLVGYDRFPDDLHAYRPGTVPDSEEEQLADRLRIVLTGLGLHEASTLPLGPRTDERQAGLRNPLSQEEAWLRRDLLSGLTRRVEHNWRQHNRDVRLFEIGRVFEAGGRTERGGDRTYTLPAEEGRVAGVVTGARRPAHWSEPHPPDADLFDVKALLEAAVAMTWPDAVVTPDGDGWVVRRGERTLGRAVPLPADRPAWAAPLYGFELALPVAQPSADCRYRPVPAWPEVQRDVALVLGEDLPAATVEATLRTAAGKLCERLWVFDEYRGLPLGTGERSVAWRLVFRAPDRTLREEEADKALARAVRAAEQAHGVRRREA